MIPTLSRALLLWIAFILAESAQGALRRLLFDEGLLIVRQAGVVVGIVILFIASWLAAPWLRLRSGIEAVGIGLVWASLTILFEGGVAQALGLDWSAMLADYDIRHGGLMPVGLLAMVITPWLVWRLRRPQLEGAELAAGERR